MNPNWLTLLTLLLGGTNLMTIIKLIVDKRKRKIDNKISEADALRSMQEQYNVWIKDSQFVQDTLREDMKQMRSELKEMKKLASTLSTRLNKMTSKCQAGCYKD